MVVSFLECSPPLGEYLQFDYFSGRLVQPPLTFASLKGGRFLVAFLLGANSDRSNDDPRHRSASEWSAFAKQRLGAFRRRRQVSESPGEIPGGKNPGERDRHNWQILKLANGNCDRTKRMVYARDFMIYWQSMLEFGSRGLLCQSKTMKCEAKSLKVVEMDWHFAMLNSETAKSGWASNVLHYIPIHEFL